jgi:hypothetical protein
MTWKKKGNRVTDSFAKIWIAVALLCAAACGAFTAWRMSVIDDSMGDALNDATHALITDSSARIRAANDVSDHLRAYADYVAAINARDISLIQSDESTDDATKTLYVQQSEVDAIPVAITKNYFPQRFVKKVVNLIVRRIIVLRMRNMLANGMSMQVRFMQIRKQAATKPIAS